MNSNIKLRFLCHLLMAAGAVLSVLMSCNDSENDKERIPYDPSIPVVLDSFYPDSGIYLEKVMMTGKNFGTDPEQIRVYFNQKKAAVVGSTGTRMYVLAPRLPGDLCTISVAIGNDSLVYDRQFKYKESVTVTTIAGNGSYAEYRDGDLANSILLPRYLCVDNENNIFVISRSRGAGTFPYIEMIARIDEEANELITVGRNVVGNAPCADPATGMISFPTEHTVGSFYTLDPKEMWAPRFREMKWPTGSDRPVESWKHCMVVNPDDGFIYTRYQEGQIVKINPRTYEVEVIYKTTTGNSYGLTFNPKTPNILYMSFWGDGTGVTTNSICSIDVTDPGVTFKKISGSTVGGFRDGPLETAQFNNPSQIYCDEDGNMYVAGLQNTCGHTNMHNWPTKRGKCEAKPPSIQMWNLISSKMALIRIFIRM
ncbi:MAG: IPT/TIG domain-containing protein [Dysgonamonadaceae bacterium]|jgi:hypothetical protein|nr:IPT/TIG domain-containing protein [Dysgonamonadaceae bacterium]